MCALPNSTDDTSTAAVRSSTAAASRSASVAAGSAASFTTSMRPVSANRSSWRRTVWNSPSVVTRRGRRSSGNADRKRTTSSCVLAPSAIWGAIAPASAPSQRA
jgi:hypothetical protein